MSKSEILYVKGMNSESDGDDGDQDIWDDRKINDAYDKAMKVANAEVAKRLAMATNSQHGSKEAAKKKRNKASRQRSSSKQPEWKVGMPCRAVYKEDNLEYEALVARIINEKECVVQFLGYDNLEIVLISSLKPSLGPDERALQIEMAAAETGDSLPSQSPRGRGMDLEFERPASPGSTESAFQKKKKSSKKKNHNRMHNHHFDLPDVSMPNMNMLRNLGSLEMPLPPPPSMPHGSGVDSEDQAVSSMLLSWYMSGYYTGLYQGLKRAKENRRHN